MSDCLLVLNPRQIPVCIEAIQALDIDTVWLSNMTEPEAAKQANDVVAETRYDRYIMLSDDTVPTRHALDLVLAQADQHPVVTGYCNLDENQYRDIVNLTTNPLPPPPPTAGSYHLMTRAQVEQAPTPAVPTTFAGLALTAMSRRLWLEHPCRTSSRGVQMDYMLSYSLQQAGIPIVAANGAYVHHVKERWNFPDLSPEKRLLVGVEPAKVTITQAKVAA